MVRGSTSFNLTPPAVMMASSRGRVAAISKVKFLSQWRKASLCFCVMRLTGKSFGKFKSSRQPSNILAGNKVFKRALMCFGPRLEISLRRRSSSCSSLRAGLRSREIATFLPCFSKSPTSLERERIMGPERPKCVKSISPKRELFFLPLARMVAVTFFKETP